MILTTIFWPCLATADKPAHSNLARIVMSSRRAFIVVSSFAMVIGVFQVRSAAAQKIQKLVMGYPTPGAEVTAEVIRRGGFFKKYGLDVDLVLLSGSSLLATAMISGQVPVSQVGAAPMVVAAVAGADTVLLCVRHELCLWPPLFDPAN